jgi:hypothetical protein
VFYSVHHAKKLKGLYTKERLNNLGGALVSTKRSMPPISGNWKSPRIIQQKHRAIHPLQGKYITDKPIAQNTTPNSLNARNYRHYIQAQPQ